MVGADGGNDAMVVIWGDLVVIRVNMYVYRRYTSSNHEFV